MKTFEKWLEKTSYEFTIRGNNTHKTYYIKGNEGICYVGICATKKGGVVTDNNSCMTDCKSVKDVIGLVKFLTEGIIEL
jgi:hypothetical protein